MDMEPEKKTAKTSTIVSFPVEKKMFERMRTKEAGSLCFFSC